MQFSTFFKAGLAGIAMLSLNASPIQAQRVGTPGGFIQFNSNAFGGLLGHEQALGTFGNLGPQGQWIGIGQPVPFPGGPLLDAYGMRIQWSEQFATTAIVGINAGDPFLETQWGPKIQAYKFNYVDDPANPASQRNVVTMSSDLQVGIRTETPFRSLQVRHPNGVNFGGGLSLQNEATNREWTMFTGTSGLELYYQGSFRGRFSQVDGVYLPISDRRLKKDVEEMENVMDRIMRLRPTTYHFNEQSESDPRSYGLIAQELKEVFPDLVEVRKDNTDPNVPDDLHIVSYTELIPVLIKGLQEQQMMIAELNETIKTQKGVIDQLGGQSGNANTKMQGAVESFGASKLYQNAPNPFDSYTKIDYNLAGKFNTAAIYVFDLNGRQLKAFEGLNVGEGSVTLMASELEAGMYLYSLVVDGEEVATKRMILTK